MREYNPEADRQSTMQSTVLSSEAITTTVVYHRAFRKLKYFAASKLHSWYTAEVIAEKQKQKQLERKLRASRLPADREQCVHQLLFS